MVFSSFEFLFIFLPATLTGFYLFGCLGWRRLAALWLAGASLFYYGWWRIETLPLLLALIVGNYAALRGLIHIAHWPILQRRIFLTLAIGCNLAVLFWFKYVVFVTENLNLWFGTGWTFAKVALPLGLSFITFQKIGLLVDAYKGKARDYDPLHYALFVSFFPQLIAGPIVHHAGFIPQFEQDRIYRPNMERFAVGLTVLAIGLFKKTVLADSIAPFADTVFAAAAAGKSITLIEGWCGALAYTFQIYFDFSGYSDMAVGLALLFGIRLPLNFFAPYRATSIVEFWRRWHMTLSRFLRDYVYISLGGNRYGKVRRYLNLLLTMILGGLWHGAGWTFVLWGLLHGLYLVVNHAWQASLGNAAERWAPRILRNGMGWVLTFVAVVVAWVFFRADNIATAMHLLASMAGNSGFMLPDTYVGKLGGLAPILADHGVQFVGAYDIPLFEGIRELGMLAALGGIALFMPNVHEWMDRQRLTEDSPPWQGSGRVPSWRPSVGWAMVVGGIAAAAVWSISGNSTFLYFDF